MRRTRTSSHSADPSAGSTPPVCNRSRRSLFSPSPSSNCMASSSPPAPFPLDSQASPQSPQIQMISHSPTPNSGEYLANKDVPNSFYFLALLPGKIGMASRSSNLHSIYVPTLCPYFCFCSINFVMSCICPHISCYCDCRDHHSFYDFQNNPVLLLSNNFGSFFGCEVKCPYCKGWCWINYSQYGDSQVNLLVLCGRKTYTKHWECLQRQAVCYAFLLWACQLCPQPSDYGSEQRRCAQCCSYCNGGHLIRTVPTSISPPCLSTSSNSRCPSSSDASCFRIETVECTSSIDCSFLQFSCFRTGTPSS